MTSRWSTVATSTPLIAFPTPPWALRRCRALSLDEAGQECNGRGACTSSGTCDCDRHYTRSLHCAPRLHLHLHSPYPFPTPRDLLSGSAFGGDYCEERLAGVPVVRLGGLFPFYASADAATQV